MQSDVPMTSGTCVWQERVVKTGFRIEFEPRWADRARFELADACASTVFKTVSLGRSDTYPYAQADSPHTTIQCSIWLLFA